jgi:hypothetical protein
MVYRLLKILRNKKNIKIVGSIYDEDETYKKSFNKIMKSEDFVISDRIYYREITNKIA